MPRRSKSPCAPLSRRVPKYKQIARGLPPNARETLPRYRYLVNRPGDKRPCHVVGDDTPGRTSCYHPTAHSARRKTCQLLVDPDNPLHTFEPGLYLVGGPRFQDETLVCTAADIVSMESEDVDTRRALPDSPVVVLGPYAHPVTGKLTVKCLLLSSFEDVADVDSFGQVFQTLDMSERGAMVPDLDMIEAFTEDLARSAHPNVDRILVGLWSVIRKLDASEKALQALDDACARDPDFERRVRTVCKCFYEMALYFRRYAGPGRRIPLDLLPPVGDPSNPLSPSLRDKRVFKTLSGVRLASNDRDAGASQAADFVMQPEGTLTNMSQENAEAILAVYDTLTPTQQTLLRRAFQLGTPYRIVNGNGRFYLNSVDPNIYNGNPADVTLNLFDMCFGTVRRSRDFYAVASVHGTRTYCVQIAAIQILRGVQTLLPYLYRARPVWALVDGEFDNVHT